MSELYGQKHAEDFFNYTVSIEHCVGRGFSFEVFRSPFCLELALPRIKVFLLTQHREVQRHQFFLLVGSLFQVTLMSYRKKKTIFFVIRNGGSEK